MSGTRFAVSVLAAAAFIVLAGQATAQAAASTLPLHDGARSDRAPRLTIVMPHRGRANGTAIVIAPGGAYVGLARALEGDQPAQWFAARGVTAFVLEYRLGDAGRLPIPLEDGARAIRLVRSRAASLGIDPRRIGMLGFSAGGHLAAMTAASADEGKPGAADPVERVSSRPDFLVLAYPWLEATVRRPSDGGSQYCDFARASGSGACDPKAYERLVPTASVSSRMPPTFLYHTVADELVDVDGTIRFFAALRRNYADVELHAFANGPHGTGLGSADPALSQWPALLQEWLRRRRLIEPAPSKISEPPPRVSSPDR